MTEQTTVAPEAAPAVPSQEAPAAPAKDTASPIEGAPESQPDKTGEVDDQDKDKPRQRASERIGELYGRMKMAERARDLALQEVERLRKPVVDNAQWDQLSYEQQQQAQTRQAVRAERAEEMHREAQIREYEAQQSRAALFADRLEAVKSTIPDIDRVINDRDLPVSEIGARFIMESEKGPQVAYWLSQNRADAARIRALDPYSQAYELGKIEARIAAAPASRRVSAAPAPAPKVGGGSNTGAKDPSSMTMSEYAEWYKKRG